MHTPSMPKKNPKALDPLTFFCMWAPWGHSPFIAVRWIGFSELISDPHLVSEAEIRREHLDWGETQSGAGILHSAALNNELGQTSVLIF